jgi:hypothetical protein
MRLHGSVRGAAGDRCSYRDHPQIVAYELECVIEQALSTEVQEKAPEIRTQWERLTAQHPFLEENAETRAAQFAAWTKRERKVSLAGLLSSLDPMYPTLYSMGVRNGSMHLVSPEEYAQWNEKDFPDPNW